jgi:hypothetical protein
VKGEKATRSNHNLTPVICNLTKKPSNSGYQAENDVSLMNE